MQDNAVSLKICGEQGAFVNKSGTMVYISYMMQLGLYSFVDHQTDPHTGTKIDPQLRMQNLLEEVRLADEVGLDVFGIGEHHRPDYLVSSPSVVLAAAAAVTKRIRLTSAVTVLSSDDPVRVFQDFATLDLISKGRAEIMVGRGSFIESFPLFGYNLNDYNELFTEKLELLLKIREENPVSWQGRHRAPLDNQQVLPRPLQNPLPVWIAVGGTPESVVRAATLGVPVAVAIIGGSPRRFVPLVELYRNTAINAGHDINKLQISINSHGLIGDDAQSVANETYPYYADVMGRLGRERGWPPYTRAQFDRQIAPDGADFIGDPNHMIDKILWEHELFGNTRFLVQFSMGAIPHKSVMRAIELYGTKVAPAVRRALQK